MLGVVAFTVYGSYSKISNNCIFLQLAVSKDLFRVVIERLRLHIVEHGYHFLCQPHASVGVHRLHPTLAIGGHKGQVVRRRGANDRDCLFFLVMAPPCVHGQN